MNALLRRGACPGLSSPMQTGDGLLVRLRPIGTIPLSVFKKLCAAARRYGNGIVEITARGSIQVRGLTAASAPCFAADVGTLGITAEDGVSIHTNPLAGLNPGEIFDAGAVAADLRRTLADKKIAMRLSPKVSVTVDDGSALNLDRLSADVRLRAELIDGAALFRISVGGDDASAADLGFVEFMCGVTAAIRLLEVIAQRGRDARARDIIASEGSALFSVAIADFLLPSNPSSCPALCRASTSYGDERDVDGRDRPGHDGWKFDRGVIGTQCLRDGSFAFGLGLAFGHADATLLEQLAEAAELSGATGMRTAPGRTLIVIGLAQNELTAFVPAAERLGFITRSDDPRRHVIACAGAPFCASGHIAARTMAPAVAKAAAQFLSGSFSVHFSGCAKGCAHPTPAALTIVGTPEGCGLIANGAARDAPFAMVPNDQMTAAIVKHAREVTGEGRHV
jgi:precorrin-3B synthase